MVLKTIVLVIAMCGQLPVTGDRSNAGCAVTQMTFQDASSEVALQMCNQAREDLEEQSPKFDSACIAQNFLYAKE